MKTKRWLLLIAVPWLWFAPGSPAATAGIAVERPNGKAEMFYDALAPHGDWFHHDRYGWVWTPHDVGYGWRPYTDGYWVYTDVGWSWESDTGWGWAPFHYGRWAYDEQYGWVWVPDTEWAPAWVAWQAGDPWCGWAPLPPMVEWEFEPAWGTLIPPFYWSFVQIDFLPERDIRRRIVPVARNVTLLHETKNVTKFVRNGDRQIVSSGVDPARVENAMGHPLPRVHIENVTSPVHGLGTMLQEDQLLVFRPDLRSAEQPIAAKPATPHAGAPSAASAATVGRNSVEPSPGLSREFLQRQEADRRRLAEEQAAEAGRLEEIHRRELQNPPNGLSLPNLAQRHLEEHRAFNEQVARQNQLFERRAQQGVPRPEAVSPGRQRR